MRKFETEIRVIYGDTDAMGVAYYGNYPRWFEIGRTELLREIGYPYADIEEVEGLFLPVVELTCRYKYSARYDDILLIKTCISKMKAATVEISYEIFLKDGGKLCAVGKTKHGITDKQLRPINIKKKYPELYQLMLDTAASAI